MATKVNICAGGLVVLVQDTDLSFNVVSLCVDPTFSLPPHLNCAAGRSGESLEHRRLDWWFGQTATLLFFIIIAHQVNRAEESTILV